jgi:hypothetical protein
LILVLYPNVHPNLLNKLLPSCIPIWKSEIEI